MTGWLTIAAVVMAAALLALGVGLAAWSAPGLFAAVGAAVVWGVIVAVADEAVAHWQRRFQ